MVKIVVRRLLYCHLPHDTTLEAACIAPYLSCYYAELEFSCGRKDVKITDVVLSINSTLKIPANRFNAIKLETGKDHTATFAFPVKEHAAIERGKFEIHVKDDSGQTYQIAGEFPVEA